MCYLIGCPRHDNQIMTIVVEISTRNMTCYLAAHDHWNPQSASNILNIVRNV